MTKTYDNANRYMFTVFQTRPSFQCMIGFWPSKAVKDREIDDIVKIDGANKENSCCYRFLSIDRYNRCQSKNNYRQLSIYRVVIPSDIGFYRLHYPDLTEENDASFSLQVKGKNCENEGKPSCTTAGGVCIVAHCY